MLSPKRILICDDSPVVHRSLSKYLQEFEGVSVIFASDGQEALDCIANERIDILFLDLTMPVMDGFEVLEELADQRSELSIIVLSADIQQQAKERCSRLGAAHFLAKPFQKQMLLKVLSEVGVDGALPTNDTQHHASTKIRHISVEPSSAFITEGNAACLTAFREIANIALGRGGAIISDHLGEFIKMPQPNVAMLCPADLLMTIHDIKHQPDSTAISQRFVGGGIHGEALICLHGRDILHFGERLGFSQVDENKHEIVVNIANLMVSSFLVALSEQMNIPFSVRQPLVMEDYMAWGDNVSNQQSLFTVEYCYKAERYDVECAVLFMMDCHSIPVIRQIMETLH